MRIILDTNIFVSGIHWKGAPSKILNLLLEKKFELISSQEIIDELVEILKSFRIPLSNEKIIEWTNWIVDNSLIVEPSLYFNVIKEDKDDNKFLEAGVEGEVDFIVSQDNHLLKLKEFQGIKIVNSLEFLVIFGE